MCVWYMSHTFYKQDSYEYWEVYHYFGNEYGIEMDEDRFCIFLGLPKSAQIPFEGVTGIFFSCVCSIWTSELPIYLP